MIGGREGGGSRVGALTGRRRGEGHWEQEEQEEEEEKRNLREVERERLCE